MTVKKYAEEQIIAVLREAEAPFLMTAQSRKSLWQLVNQRRLHTKSL